MPGQYTKFELFKRRLYLTVLPLLILAILSSYLNWEGTLGLFDIISLVLILWYIIAWILLYRRKGFRFVELFTLMISSITHIITTYFTIYWIVVRHLDTIGSAGYWTTLIYIYIFITLRGKAGVIYSCSLWFITFCIALFFWTDVNQEFRSSFTQYMIANLVYICFLFSARQIIRTYAEAEILEKMAFQDSLTGIANRRQLHLWINQLIKKQVNPMSVIFLDIDHFKRINDQYGHFVGDQVLLEFTTLIKNNIPTDAYFGRWGGEEFVIITRRHLHDTVKLAEELKNIVEEHTFYQTGKVTSSFGIEGYKEGDLSDTLLDRADTALYFAKEAGRNIVKVYEQNEKIFKNNT